MSPTSLVHYTYKNHLRNNLEWEDKNSKTCKKILLLLHFVVVNRGRDVRLNTKFYNNILHFTIFFKKKLASKIFTFKFLKLATIINSYKQKTWFSLKLRYNHT